MKKHPARSRIIYYQARDCSHNYTYHEALLESH